MGTPEQHSTSDPYQFYAHVHGLAAADGVIRGRLLQAFNALAIAGTLAMGTYALTRNEPVEAARWGLAAAAHVIGWRSQRLANQQHMRDVGTYFGQLQTHLQNNMQPAAANAAFFDPTLNDAQAQAIGATQALRWRQASAHSSFAAIDLWAAGGSLANLTFPGAGLVVQGAAVAFAGLAAWQYSKLKQGLSPLGQAAADRFLRDNTQMELLQRYVDVQHGRIRMPLHVSTLVQARNGQLP